MPRRPTVRSRSRVREQPAPLPAAPRPDRLGSRRWQWVLAGLLIVLAPAAIARLILGSPDRSRAEAERAERARDWAAAARAWRTFNTTDDARGVTHLSEARALLALGQAGQAELSLRRAIAADPADPEPWRLLLEILRVQDRALDAQQVVWDSYDQIPAETRREVLRGLTLALLADLPDESVRAALERWIGADPNDVDARVAMLQRIAALPRAADPDRKTRLAELETLVAEHPEHPGARAALVTALADAGEPDRGRAVLDGWPGPEPGRDARYWRLRGRWELEYDRHPEQAAAAFRRSVETFAYDWRSWSGLARALTRLGRDTEARQAAEVVGRIREALEPATLGPRLDDDFRHLDDPRAVRDLADLADHAGLSRLAGAWRAEADAPANPPPGR